MSVGIALGLIAVGLVTGTITSLVGASGVMVVVPALTMLFHMNAHMAIGSSLLVDVITSAVVAIGYFRAKNVRLEEGLWIAAASVLGAFVGARWAGAIPEGPLTLVFAIVMIVSGIATLVNASKKSVASAEIAEEKAAKTDDAVAAKVDGKASDKADGTVAAAANDAVTAKTVQNASDTAISEKTTDAASDGSKSAGLHFKAKWQQILALIVVGFAIGIISGLVGAGGGVMVLLALIFILRYPMHEAVGTSTVIMAITALASTIGYGMQGSIDYQWSLLIALGAVVAGIIGSKFANKIDERRLKQIVSILFIVIGVLMCVMQLVSGK
jgi:uncharacterized membrane protein YfcA